jgi:hypothetical protein
MARSKKLGYVNLLIKWTPKSEGKPYHLTMYQEKYVQGGGVALVLVDEGPEDPGPEDPGPEDPGPFCVLTVNGTGVTQEGEYVIKNYSENESIVRELIAQGVLVPQGPTVASGFATMPICKLALDKLSKK